MCVCVLHSVVVAKCGGVSGVPAAPDISAEGVQALRAWVGTVFVTTVFVGPGLLPFWTFLNLKACRHSPVQWAPIHWRVTNLTCKQDRDLK